MRARLGAAPPKCAPSSGLEKGIRRRGCSCHCAPDLRECPFCQLGHWDRVGVRQQQGFTGQGMYLENLRSKSGSGHGYARRKAQEINVINAEY